MLQEPPVIFLGKHDMFSCFFVVEQASFYVWSNRNQLGSSQTYIIHQISRKPTDYGMQSSETVFHNVGPPFDS